MGTKPYGFMSKFQALSGADLMPQQLAAAITDWLVSTPTAQEALTEGVVTAFERSPSYDRTRRLTALLKKLPRLFGSVPPPRDEARQRVDRLQLQ